MYGRLNTFVAMALLGNLLFCTDCGDLLERVAAFEKIITCKVCGTENESESKLHAR